MQFKKIEIENFGTIGHVELPLENRGLVLITGRNKDAPKACSNGAGKSLLLDAFCWCIWGRTIREDKDDDVVNTKIGKDCKVVVQFTDNTGTFQVSRFRKHTKSVKPNDLEIHLGDTNLSGASVKATQEAVNGVVGLTFDTFCAMMPGSGKNAAQMTDSAIKELLENMLQTTALARARDETEARLKPLRINITKLSSKITDLTNQVAKDTSRLQAFEQEQVGFLVTQAGRVDDLDGKISLRVEEIAGAEITHKTAALAQIELTSLQTQYEQRKQVACTEEAALAKDKKELDDVLATSTASVVALETELRLALKAQEAFNSLEESCATCKQDIPTSHKDEQATLFTTKQQVMRTALADAKEEQKSVTDAIAVLVSKLRENKSSYEAALSELTDRARVQDNKVREGREASVRLVELRKALDSLEAEKARIAAEESPYAAWIQQTSEDIAALNLEITENQEKLESSQKLESKLEFWKHAFSAKGIRSFILDNITPVLNERAQHYCDILTEGEMRVDFSTQTTLKSGEVREKFSINISQEHGGSSYTSNSKGERQRANLAVCFALSDLAEMHSHKRVDFRFLDEPFEGIDESGTDAVLALLNEQREKYPTVFVVTHQGHFKDVFPSEITMVKEQGMSRLEEC